MGGPDRLWWILLVTAALVSPFFFLAKAVQAHQREREALQRQTRSAAAERRSFKRPSQWLAGWPGLAETGAKTSQDQPRPG